jgi:hypothetical protein
MAAALPFGSRLVLEISESSRFLTLTKRRQPQNLGAVFFCLRLFTAASGRRALSVEVVEESWASAWGLVWLPERSPEEEPVRRDERRVASHAAQARSSGAAAPRLAVWVDQLPRGPELPLVLPVVREAQPFLRVRLCGALRPAVVLLLLAKLAAARAFPSLAERLSWAASLRPELPASEMRARVGSRARLFSPPVARQAS